MKPRSSFGRACKRCRDRSEFKNRTEQTDAPCLGGRAHHGAPSRWKNFQLRDRVLTSRPQEPGTNSAAHTGLKPHTSACSSYARARQAPPASIDSLNRHRQTHTQCHTQTWSPVTVRDSAAVISSAHSRISVRGRSDIARLPEIHIPITCPSVQVVTRLACCIYLRRPPLEWEPKAVLPPFDVSRLYPDDQNLA